MGRQINETSIKIRGDVYQLRTDLDAERISTLAARVNGVMDELDPTESMPTSKLAVLTALTLAGECLDAGERTHRMCLMLDEELTKD